LVIFLLLWPLTARGGATVSAGDSSGKHVPILAYHRFGPVVSDGMTVTTSSFESQLKTLRENRYTVIRLRQLVDFLLGRSQAPPPRAVVLTVDDGHKSVYTDLLPLLKKYQAPATLFLYPSAISNASYAMTWDQIREIKTTGLCDLQSHTFWHPNFKNEKKKLNPGEYQRFVDMQLRKSKEKLERELQVKVDLLAWPFGIYDDELMHQAAAAGYVAALSIDRRHASPLDQAMALPRYLIANSDPLFRNGL
jgi:peptidoglycan/xylan/chitin deacetylase (PgdA/CDA1 family)